MLLRSSSTPVLGSLLSSFAKSPNHHHRPETQTSSHQNHNKLSFHQIGQLYCTTYSCTSSPISPSVADTRHGFRRAQSEGNLQGLANASCNTDNMDHEYDYEPAFQNPPKMFPRRPNCSMLETIPSFSFHNSKSRIEEDDSDEEEDQEKDQEPEEKYQLFDNAILEQQNRVATNTNAFELTEEKTENLELDEEMRFVSPEMFFGGGLGIQRIDKGISGLCIGAGGDGIGGNGDGGECIPAGFGGDGGDGNGLEEHYKRMVEQDPTNALFLRNYAQFLCQTKQDLRGAEEYYSRAILADPKDGEVLAQYAKLIWEIHRDKDRAASYFERAIQAASADSHVHAAYASFLWETDDEDEDQEDLHDKPDLVPLLYKGSMASASA